MKQLLESESLRPFRYLVTGGIAWLVDLAVFTFFLPIVGIAPAQLAARIVGAVVAFVGHKLFVFRSVEGNPSTLAGQSARYAALGILAYISSAVALIFLIEYLHWNVVAAKIIVEVGVVLMNYTVMKTMIFHRRQHKENNE